MGFVTRDKRITIEVKPDALHEAVTAAEDALIAAQAPIFQQGTSLVMVSAIGKTKSLLFKVVDSAVLRDHLSRAAVFTKRDSRREGTRVIIPPPVIVAKLLLSRAGEWRFERIPSRRPKMPTMISCRYCGRDVELGTGKPCVCETTVVEETCAGCDRQLRECEVISYSGITGTNSACLTFRTWDRVRA
jgi:hypothetical protein